MLVAWFSVLWGIILFTSFMFLGEVFPYHSGIAMGLVGLGFMLAIIFKGIDLFRGGGSSISKILVSGFVLIGAGCVIGLYTWLAPTNSVSEGLGGALLAYMFLFVGGMIVVFAKVRR